MKRILIRADGSRQSGFGHLSRCAILARAFETIGYEVRFLVHGADEAVRLFIDSRGFKYAETAFKAGAEGGERHWDAMKEFGASFTVLDSYRIDAAYRARLNGMGARIAVMDDLYSHYSSAHAVVNNNLSADGGRYEGFTGKLLLGPAYATIDPAFASRGRGPETGLPELLVIIGATDALGQLPRVLRLLDGIEKEFTITAVGGYYAAQPRLPEVRHRLEMISFTGDMPSIVARCTGAITAGGISCMELACAGKPFVVVLADRFQIENALAFERAGAGRYAGALWERTDKELQASFQSFLEEKEHWPSMAESGRSLIDGRGAERAARQLDSYFSLK